MTDTVTVPLTDENKYNLTRAIDRIALKYAGWDDVDIDETFESVSAPSPMAIDVVEKVIAPLLAALPPQPLSNPQQLEAQPEAQKGEPVAIGYLEHAAIADLRNGFAGVTATVYGKPESGCEAIYTHPAPSSELLEARARIAELEAKLNTPEVEDFARAVVLEAQHQRDRWSSEYDAGKAPLDWFWLIGYLAQKAASAQMAGDTFKALHHTISTAAALANWHAAISGDHTAMRPGIATPCFDQHKGPQS